MIKSYIKKNATKSWLTKNHFKRNGIFSEGCREAHSYRFPVYKYGASSCLDCELTVLMDGGEVIINVYDHNTKNKYAPFYCTDNHCHHEFLVKIRKRIENEMKKTWNRGGEKMKVRIKKINKNAITPTIGSDGSAGHDIYACISEKIAIHPHKTVMIPTGFCAEMEKGTVALIYSRSGIAARRGLVVCQGTGVVDSDYRGEWIVPLHNDTNDVQTVASMERIAQVIFTDYIVPEFEEVECLSETERGDGGFGSTGRSRPCKNGGAVNKR